MHTCIWRRLFLKFSGGACPGPPPPPPWQSEGALAMIASRSTVPTSTSICHAVCGCWRLGVGTFRSAAPGRWGRNDHCASACILSGSRETVRHLHWLAIDPGQSRGCAIETKLLQGIGLQTRLKPFRPRTLDLDLISAFRSWFWAKTRKLRIF